MIFKECLRWRPDNKKESSEAIVVVSNCGTIVKRLPYIRWNSKNQNYSYMKEHLYPHSFNRGKQRKESEEHIKKYGYYRYVIIKGKIFPIHRLVALAFIPNPNNYPHIDHINERRDDNRVENLRWCTNAQNAKYISKEKRIERREKLSKLNIKTAKEALKLRLEGKGIVELAKQFNVSHECIRTNTLYVSSQIENEQLEKNKQKIKSWNRFIKKEVGIIQDGNYWRLIRKGKKIYSSNNKKDILEAKSNYIKKHNFTNG